MKRTLTAINSVLDEQRRMGYNYSEQWIHNDIRLRVLQAYSGKKNCVPTWESRSLLKSGVR